MVAISITRGGPRDPCDSYGDCVSASVIYARANPDDSLYVGDQFRVALFIVDGSGGASCGQGCSESWYGVLSSVEWSYDHSVLSASTTETSGQFMVSGNRTGTFTISETAIFTVTITVTVCGQTSCSSYSYTVQSSVVASEQADVIQLVLQETYSIANVTDRDTGFNLRNPDGSFYRNDSFCIRWSASFEFSNARPDILVNVTGSLPAFLSQVSSNYTGSTPGRQGFVCYDVALTASYDNATLLLNFNAINWRNESIAHIIRGVPFAVVQYSPHFSYFTYMLYNSLASSAYQRPFVTLVRYGGNDPGYSYTGDANTAKFEQGNSTGERAYINNFTFATTGWNLTMRLVSANISGDITFNRNSSSIGYRSLNSTYDMITWRDRVQKYYLQANATGFGKLSELYYNVTASARSADFAGARTTLLFNTTYLYEPVQYSGYLTFNFYSADGKADTSANVTVTSHNPNPLSTYLLSRVEKTFGDDPNVLRAFTRDLYPSGSEFELKQLRPNTNGTIVYLVNQTNLATLNDSSFPWFDIVINSSVLAGTSYQFSGQPPYLTGGVALPCTYSPQRCSGVSYEVQDSWSLFLANASALGSLPFPNTTAYYLTPTFTNLALPLNSTAQAGPTWYVNWLANTAEGSVINPNLPISREPGQLTTLYQLLYGQNATVDVNTAGGGIGFMPPVADGSEYRLAFLVSPQSGGVTRLWVVDNEGNTLTNETILPTTPSITSFSPPGYHGGYYTASVPAVANSTMTATLLNAWGAKTVITGIPVSVSALASPVISWNFVILVTVVLLGIGALSSLLTWSHARRKEGG